ncbi:MAG: DinB family protein [Planctomycetota bacterium]
MSDLLDLYRRQFDYTQWANRSIAHMIRSGRPDDEFIIAQLAHIGAVQQLWLNRIRAFKPEHFEVWPTLSLEDATSYAVDETLVWSAWQDAALHNGLHAAHAYTNSRGEDYQSTAADMMTQVVLHGMHHRGVITRRLRDHDVAVSALDFIHWARTVDFSS